MIFGRAECPACGRRFGFGEPEPIAPPAVPWWRLSRGTTAFRCIGCHAALEPVPHGTARWAVAIVLAFVAIVLLGLGAAGKVSPAAGLFAFALATLGSRTTRWRVRAEDRP